MAKAVAHCTCRICGDTFTKDNICYNRREADNWEAWAERNYDLCGKCYAKQQREMDIQKGLYIDIRLSGSTVIMRGEKPIAIIFGGDTMLYKDEIKALGADWTQEYPSTGVLGDLMGDGPRRFRWTIWCDFEELDEKLNQARELGAKINTTPSDVDIAMFRQLKAEVDQRHQLIQSELDQIGKMPAWPEDIKNEWPSGAKWNGKFYGKTGSWSIYLSGKQILLSDEQKKSMEAVWKQRIEWKKKKKEIEEKYRR